METSVVLNSTITVAYSQEQTSPACSAQHHTKNDKFISRQHIHMTSQPKHWTHLQVLYKTSDIGFFQTSITFAIHQTDPSTLFF